jgi:hypothetical protein
MLYRISLLLVVVAVLLPMAGVQAQGAQWAERRPITMTNPNAGELRDFQIRVTLDASNFDFAQSQPAGNDLRVTDASGTKQLNFWVEQFDAAKQQATVWVKVPQLPAGADTTLYLYAGNNAAPSLSSGRRTFEMFDEFGFPGAGYFDLSAPATVLTQTLPWETKPPHTLSVIENDRDGYQYWGYYGLADCGGIGISRSNDLLHWDKMPEPLLNKDGERWPAALKVDGTIYMIYDRDHCGISHLVLRKSADGLHFSDPYRIIVRREAGIRNQNPALFRDPATGLFHLYWFRGGADAGFWQIKMRSAATIEGLADSSSEKVLLDVPYELAAPNMMAVDGVYYLSAEVNENAWKTIVYAGPTPAGPFTLLPDAPQMSDNQACLFQHVFTATVMHGYYCKDTGAGWVLNYRTADLSKGRSMTRRIDVGVWNKEIGDWRLENTEGANSGIALIGEGKDALIRTAFPGTDSIFTAKGRVVNGAWGVAARVQNDGSHVRAVLLTDGWLAIERASGNNVTALASVPLTNVDPKTWHELSMKLIGEHIEVFIDGQSVASAIDSTPAQGNSAIFVDGSAQIDKVMWRKAAAQEPTVAIGKRETQADAKNGWLLFAPSPTPAPAPQPMPTPMPVEHSADATSNPLMLVMAVASLIIAGGILLVGLRRQRQAS